MKRLILLLLFLNSILCWGQTSPHYLQITGVPVADITKYGAKSTNTGAQNDVAIAAAVTALKAQGGGTLFVPAGIFNASSTISIDFDGVKISGISNLTSVIYSTANPIINATGTFSADAADHKFSLNDIKIQGAGALAGATGVSVFNRFVNVWSNVVIKDVQTGVFLDTCYYTTFQGCAFRANTNAIDATKSNAAFLHGCWFVESGIDLTNCPHSVISECDMESGGTTSNGMIIGGETTIRNTRLERVNYHKDMPFVTFAGDNSRYYENAIVITHINAGRFTPTIPMIKIIGDSNDITLDVLVDQTVAGDRYGSSFVANTDGAIDNKVNIRYIAGLTETYGAVHKIGTSAINLSYDCEANRKSMFLGASCHGVGVFQELGTINTGVASSTLWTNAFSNVAAIATQSELPDGYVLADNLFYYITPNSATPTQPVYIIRTLDTAPTSGEPVTMTALVRNTSSKNAYMGLQNVWGTKIPPNTDWQWVTHRCIASSTITEAAQFYLIDNNDDSNAYWVTGDGILEVGAISVVSGNTPCFVGATNATATFFGNPVNP